jgi:cytochrome b561
MMAATDTYTGPQITLHWIIVGLVAAQFLTADAMEAFFDNAEEAGVPAGFPTNATAIAHAIGGSIILVLMLARLGVRLAYGAPQAPRSLMPALQLASRITHYGFYVLLVALPASGMIALYVTAEAGDLHGLLKTALVFLILAHVGGALFHALILRDGVASRMLPFLRRLGR